MSDPGFWRRGMSRRGTTIVIVVCVVIIVGALVYAGVSGLLF